MSTEIEKKEETGVDTILQANPVKDYTGKEDKQIIKLLDVEGVEKFLNGLVEEYKDVEITRENVKKEGAEAERRLRQARYSLQNIHKSNSKVLNEAKKAEKALVDRLIGIIQPLEKKLYDQMAAVKKVIADEKAAKEKAEQERKEKISNMLSDYELKLEKLVNSAKDIDAQMEYKELLDELEGKFEEFDEKEFEAKRIHAVYTGRKSEITDRIAKIAQEKKDAEAKAKAEKEAAEKLAKVVAFRKKQVQDFLKAEDAVKLMAEWSFDEEKHGAMDEVDWAEEFESLKNKTKAAKEKADKDAKKSILNMKKTWDELITEFRKIGGNTRTWKLKKGDMPTQDMIDRLREAVKQQNAKNNLLKAQEVKTEIIPFKDDILDFFGDMTEKIKNTKFKHPESKQIIENLMDQFNDSCNEVLGEVMNGGEE